MLTRDRMVLESIRSIRDYSLWQLKGLVTFYWVWQGGMILFSTSLPTFQKVDWMSFALWSGWGLALVLGQFVVLLWAVLEAQETRKRILPKQEVDSGGPNP
jgi:hypothetical protein